MIPKKIHYCWLSGDEFPESISRCMASWKDKLPDYEFVLWDAKRFDIEGNTWVKQAFKAKKYAFAADYIRLHAVYSEGGIYMDTDVEVVRNFDDLLHLPYFAGTEGGGIIEAGVFGAQAGADWLRDCLRYYDGREFIKPDGSFDTWTLPRIMMQQIGLSRRVVEMSGPDFIAQVGKAAPDRLLLFPRDFFCAKEQGTGVVTKTENTYTIHHFAMSWLPKSHTFLPNLKRRLMSVFGVGFMNAVIRVLRLRQIRDAIGKQKS